MVRLLSVILVLVPAVASAQYDGPPGLARAPEANLLPANLDAPIQSEKTPGLTLLSQVVHKQELHFRDGKVVIELDGSVHLTPLYGVFTLRFGSRDRYSLQIRRALEATFEERVAMRAQYREAAMQFALADLPNYLDRVWEHPSWSKRERKRILFALWDECAEGGSNDVVEGAVAARHIIEAFIRWKLPQHGATRFDADELAELNRIRTSNQRFAPYRQPLTIPGQLTTAALTF